MGDFNLTGEALRKLMICAVDVSEGAAQPIWEIQGYKTEDSSIELNPDITTITDVLGDTYSDVNKFEEQQTFEPNTLRLGAMLNELLLKYWRYGQLEKFSQFKVLIGYGFIGADGAYEADVYTASTIEVTSIGGSSRVNMPFNIHFGGEKHHGTIDKLKGADIAFTETVESPTGG